MKPATCNECLWSGHERCPYHKPLAFMTGPVPDDCTEALRRITAEDIARVVLNKEGRAVIRKQAEQHGIFHPAFILAMLDFIDMLESDLEDARGETQEADEQNET